MLGVWVWVNMSVNAYKYFPPVKLCVWYHYKKRRCIYGTSIAKMFFIIFSFKILCKKKFLRIPKLLKGGGGWPPLTEFSVTIGLFSLKCTWSLREDFGWRTKKYHNFFPIYEKMIFFLRLGSLTPSLLVVRPIKQMVSFPYVLTASASFEEMISWSARTESACSITNTHWDKSGGIF